MTKLAPTTQRAFDAWIKQDTWYRRLSRRAEARLLEPAKKIF